MSNIRLFYPESLSKNLSGKLNKDQSKYLISVMRLKINEIFSLFNKEGEWNTKIIFIDKGIVEFEVQNQLRQPYNEREIWLVFTPIKSNYFNFMIQKATEIGVTKFFPITTERTIVRKINKKRRNKIIIEASEQSNRLKVPKINKMTTLDSFLELNQNTTIIFGDLNANKKKINLKSKETLCILIGPEGDFTTKEREKIFKYNNVIPLNINNNILRSETAAISIISIIVYNFLS